MPLVRNFAPATTSTDGLMSATDKTKLDGVATGANNYTHPATHSPSEIAQDANNRFVSDAKKAEWDAKATTAAATTSAAGLVELATTAETQAGTDATRAVTPAGLAAWPRTGSVTVTVGPSGCDYTTLNGAISALCTRYPGHGARATINVAVNFVMAEQVLVRGQNLGWITISGEGSTTPRSIQTSAITATFDGTITAIRPVFGAAFGGTLPVMVVPWIFDATTPAEYMHGLALLGGASAVFLHGIQNTPAGGKAAYVDVASRAYLAGNWSGGSRAEGLRCGGSCFTTGNWRSSSGTDASTDIVVAYGGTISLHSATVGGISQAKNTLTASGIIYDPRT